VSDPTHSESYERLIGYLHDPANVQQTSSKRPALARVFWIHLLEICWIVFV